MTLRHPFRAGLAALLAVGPALVLTPAPAQAATQAAKPGYVAVVISGHGTHCVKWKSGITGDTVLNAAATVGYRSDGLIVQIDGSPSSGTADASHFWSYWHDVSGKKWAYSNYGASAYKPAAGSVEGWSYDNGKSSAPSPSQNPAGLYAKTCGAKDRKRGTVFVPVPSTSTRSATTRATAPPTPSRPSHRHHSTPVSTSPPSTSDPTSSTPESASTSAPSSVASSAQSSAASSGRSSSASRTGASRSSSGAASPAASSAGPSSPPAASRHPARTIDASSAASTSSSSGSPVGLFVGLGLVVVLGAGAGAVALRRRHAGG